MASRFDLKKLELTGQPMLLWRGLGPSIPRHSVRTLSDLDRRWRGAAVESSG
ncbi:MAG TPA: hypothetical protein VF128_03390 [Gemmatimonadaceae bacterium]